MSFLSFKGFSSPKGSAMRSKGKNRPNRRHGRALPRLEALEDRSCPSVTAVFTGGVLTLTGDGADDNISVTADAGGALTFTGTATTPTVDLDDVDQIVVDLGGGNDIAVIDFS